MAAKSLEAKRRAKAGQKSWRDKNRDYLNTKARQRYHQLKASGAGSTHMSNLVRETRKRKKDWLVQYKESSGCKDCKVKYPHYVLEFDHCRGEKKFSLGLVGHRSWEAMIAEIEKCDVVCANCHKIREWKRWRKNLSLSSRSAEPGCVRCSKKFTRTHQTLFCSSRCRDSWIREASTWPNGVRSENQKRHAKDKANGRA